MEGVSNMKGNKKRFISLCGIIALSLTLTLSACSKSKDSGAESSPAASASASSSSGTGGETDSYAEHYTFTMATLDLPKDNDPLIAEISKKFNVDFKFQHLIWDTWAEQIRTIVASGDMPDVLLWYPLSYGEYVNWAKQGIFKALPDFSAYPHIKETADRLKVIDKLKIDGKLYAWPKPLLAANPINDINATNVLYRWDWAKKLGYNYEQVQTVTYEEFKQLLRDFKDKDPGGNGPGKTVPMVSESGSSEMLPIQVYNSSYDSYRKIDGNYVWAPTLPATAQGIKEMQSFYKEGLLYKDFFLAKTGDQSNLFLTNKAGVFQSASMNVEGLKLMSRDLKDKGKVADPSQALGILIVKGIDGKVPAVPMAEYWSAYALNGEMDDKKMDRFLQIQDYIMNPDNLPREAFGVEGTDWEKSADGKITVKWPKNAAGEYEFTKENGKDYIPDGVNIVLKWFKLEGDTHFLPDYPYYEQWQRDLFVNAQKAKEAAGVTMAPIDYQLDFFSAPNKDKFGSFTKEVFDEITNIVVKGKDVDQEWQNWLSKMEPKVKPILDEINEGVK